MGARLLGPSGIQRSGFAGQRLLSHWLSCASVRVVTGWCDEKTVKNSPRAVGLFLPFLHSCACRWALARRRPRACFRTIGCILCRCCGLHALRELDSSADRDRISVLVLRGSIWGIGRNYVSHGDGDVVVTLF